MWFGNSALLDIPFRPHLWIKPGEDKMLPVDIGDYASNRDAVRLRFELGPYYYSLAHAAYTKGDPIIAPLAYYFQKDPTVRQMGHQAMIGPHLMMGIVATVGERQRNVYLPEGLWYDFYSHELLGATEPEGHWQRDVTTYRDGKFKVPLFAKEGAIIPMSQSLPDNLEE